MKYSLFHGTIESSPRVISLQIKCFFNPGASCFESGYCVGCYYYLFLICRKFYPKLNLIIKDPVIVPTPYGGRLEWDLPSGTRLIAHLKDKVKIRHKKRWSQVSHLDNSDKKLIFQLRFMHMSNIIPLDSKYEIGRASCRERV